MRPISNALYALLLGAVASLPSCVLLPGYDGPARRARGPQPPPLFAWKDLRGVVHCHSYLSHDSKGTPEEIAQAANRVGLDFLIMTDHYTDRGVSEAMRGFHGRTLFLPGAECRKDGKYFLALGIERVIDFEKSWAGIHEQIAAQGGLLFLDHFEEYGDEFEQIPFDGVEIYNVHAAVKLTNPLFIVLRGLFLPPLAVFPSLCWLHQDNLQRWEKASRSRPIPISAGNDAHNNVRLFGPLGGTVGTYEQLFRTVTTHVWAKENSREEILAALRECRSFVAFEWLADATGFQVEEIVKEGQPVWRIFSPEEARIVLLRDGAPVAETQGQWLEAPIESPGSVYRVEIYLRDKIWILGGPYFTSRKTPT